MARVLGISASLRNARFGIKRDTLAPELEELATREELIEYLRRHTQFRIDDFVATGRASFDKIYAGVSECSCGDGCKLQPAQAI